MRTPEMDTDAEAVISERESGSRLRAFRPLRYIRKHTVRLQMRARVGTVAVSLKNLMSP